MIKVIKPGVLLTIQDLGRVGYRHLGVSTAGSLDSYAHIIANRLLNNHDNDAVLEVTVGLCELEFNCDTLIALHGADLHAKLDGRAIYPGWTYAVKNKQLLTFDIGRGGLRAYLAVKGGIQCPLIMGSRSTDLNAGFGGLHGRALSAGDVIPIQAAANTQAMKQIGALTPAKRKAIRLHPSPHAKLLGPKLVNHFLSTGFKVSCQSNRMGLRLSHADTQQLVHCHSLPSLAVSPGSIQLPPNGEPIVLLNDGQTTGGYPLLGNVIAADLHQLAQFNAGDEIVFNYVSFAQAQQAQQALAAHLAQLNIALHNARG
jgi:5-oxoprolinase (ATP-hydrolysing) subunit C